MFKIGFTISLALAVLKMLDIISCSWLMVLLPMLIVIAIVVVLTVVSVVGLYFLGKKENKEFPRKLKIKR